MLKKLPYLLQSQYKNLIQAASLLLACISSYADYIHNHLQIQVISVRTGKNSLKRRVKEFRADELAVSTA